MKWLNYSVSVVILSVIVFCVLPFPSRATNTYSDGPPISNASGSYAAKNRIFEVTLPNDSLGEVKIVKEKSLSFTSTNAQISHAKLRGNKIIYSNAYKSSDVEYQTTDSGLKESIILRSSSNLPEEFSYTFDAKDLDAALGNDNSITFTQISKEAPKDIPVSDGTVITAEKAANFLPEHPQRFKLIPPVMIDASGKRSEATDVKVILDKNSLVLIPNKDWLKKATFPVILDPSVETIPQIVEELAEKRTSTAKEFLNDDGSFTSVIFQNPIHYQDGQSYKNIDRTFKESADPNYQYQVTAGIYTAQLKKTLSGNSDINLAFSNTNIGFSPFKIGWSNGESLGSVKNINGSISGDGSKITYKSLFGITGIDLEGIYDNEKFLKETVINTKEAIQIQNHINDNLEIAFNLDIPSDVELKVNGSIWDKTSPIETEDKITVIKNGQEISDLRRAIVYSQNSSKNSQTIKIKLAKNGNNLTLTKIIPGAWLEKASYPVRTDTTDVIYADATDGYLYSRADIYSDARAGTGPSMILGGGGVIAAGQEYDDYGDFFYIVYEGFESFDTSVVGSDTVSAATLTLTAWGNSGSSGDTLEARAQDWGVSLTTADWIAGASLSNNTLLASIAMGWTGEAVKTLTSEAAFVSNINGSGSTRILLSSNQQRLGNVPSGMGLIATWYTADEAGTSKDPKLTVVHAAANATPTNDSLTFTNPNGGSGNDAVADDSTEWNFQAQVTDTDGYANLSTVVLRLANSSDSATPFDSLKFTWDQATDAFSETADTQTAASITSTGTDSTCSGNTCTLNFKIKFNSGFTTTSTNYNAEAYTTDDSAASDTDTYTSFYQVTPLADTISISSPTDISLGNISTFGGSVTGEATWTVTTNASNGYKLEWQAGSANMTSGANSIGAYTPASADTPETWSIATNVSEWGARLKSTSTDYSSGTWGSDDSSNSKWLNVNNASVYQVISRGSATAGSDESIQFKAQVGSQKIQLPGNYTVNVTVTATSL